MVTGISPIEGVPGTKVIIRGENFGNRPEDLIGLFSAFSFDFGKKIAVLKSNSDFC